MKKSKKKIYINKQNIFKSKKKGGSNNQISHQETTNEFNRSLLENLKLALNEYPLHFDYDIISHILKKNNAIMSGGFILSLYDSKIVNGYLKKKWDSNDIDFYVDLENAQNFYIDLVSYFNAINNKKTRESQKIGLIVNTSNIAPQYDESFFLKIL